MVWEKMRNGGGFADHYLVDSARPSNDVLRTNSTAIPSSPWGGYSFSNNGYTSGLYWNSPATVASWTFRKAPKFFDVVTYTGNGVIGRQIPHNLGVAPGMIIVKQTSGAGGAWRVYHRGTDATAPQDYIMQLQDTASRATSSAWSNTAPTNSVFTVNGAGGTNADTETYVAYIFAHDTSTDGIIQCGSFTTDASGNASVNLGWEPQYVIWKRSDGVGDWFVQDNMRGVAVTDSTYKSLSANTSGTEQNITMVFNSTGFKTPANYTSANAIYCAIRRPNKPPTSGTQMYNAISRATTSSDDIIS
ncbi:TPA: hypothetical protein DCZ31_05080 [Patescibacteria group bacterium]|nr:hypothetical protein [Candidatus Gracilibacteria bacterium]